MDELAKERYDLAVERIREIREEKTVAEPYLDFFTKTAGFLEEMIRLRDRVEAVEMKKLSLEELRRENTQCYQDILPENYPTSYASPDYAAKITGPVGEWTAVESGDVTGYVKTEYILTGAEAQTYAENLVTEAQQEGKEEAEAFTYAVSRKSEEAQMTQEVQENVQQTETTEVSAQPASNGQAIVDYACQFIGNPYVWGGTSLTDGADCSGFVQSVFAHFGISLPRTTYDQIYAGVEVSYDQAMPGDLICYDGHIGIYIGNGQIVNAQNPEQGIGISPATYTTILSVRRIV